MAEVPNGSRKVYEVNETVRVGRAAPGFPIDDFAAQHVATFWDKDEAQRFSSAINPDIEVGHLGHFGEGVSTIPIVVVDGEAYYDVKEEPVPVELLASSAPEAAIEYIVNHDLKRDIPTGIVRLILQMVDA